MVSIDPRELRKALGAFLTGVTVITTRDKDGTPRGFTANSFTSVSLDPPLVLACLAKAAGSRPVFEAADGYAVNILAEDQRDVSNTFASRTADRFASVGWREGPVGNPIFDGSAAWLDCRMHEIVEAGDHLILIGQVEAFESTPRPPLGYCRGAYMTFGLEQQAVAGVGQNARIGAILERESEILLFGDTLEGPLDVPAGKRIGNSDEPDTLLGKLSAAGIDAQLGFLFAVFEGDADHSFSVYYRGTAAILSGDHGQPDRNASNGPKARFYRFDDIPWHRIPDETIRSMLRRYVNEKLQARFGIYVGDNVTGRIHALKDEG